jgi:transcriptional regulator with XRE-family HTH domain
MTIGPIIKARRTSCGWSLQNLADRVGVSKTHIWEIEKGLTNISLDLALRFAASFAMTIDELTSETTPSKTLIMACDLVRHIQADMAVKQRPGVNK